MNNNKISGILFAVTAYLLWGVFPIYWKALSTIHPLEILSNRIIWALLFTSIILIIRKQLNEVKIILSDKTLLLYIFSASVLIAINWGVYIWAVNTNHIIDASLG
mgnify:CR=1 FL=1